VPAILVRIERLSLLTIIDTIADGRWRKVSRHQAAIQTSIESAAPLAADAIEPAQQGLAESHHRFDDPNTGSGVCHQRREFVEKSSV
jgi:hypothetical protein